MNLLCDGWEPRRCAPGVAQFETGPLLLLALLLLPAYRVVHLGWCCGCVGLSRSPTRCTRGARRSGRWNHRRSRSEFGWNQPQHPRFITANERHLAVIYRLDRPSTQYASHCDATVFAIYLGEDAPSPRS